MEKECKHNFQLATIQEDYNPSTTIPLYQKIAIVVCTKCGEVKRQNFN